MWHALRAELAYFRPWLLGGLGIAAFVVVLLSVLVRFLEEGDGPPTFVIAMFPIIAGMVVSFIAQSYRVEERRARLLMAGPLTPRQLAGVTVLLPGCFVGLGVLAAAPMIGLATLITGPLAQESTAARRQQRSTAAIVGWAVFVGAILVLAASQFFMHSIYGHFGVAMAAVAAMGVAAALYQRRTDFTR